MKKFKKVLLISPLRDRDVFCGDVIYTETLLSNPPSGFEYITYGEALDKRWIIERRRLRFLPELWRIDPKLFWQDLFPAIFIFLLNILRRANILINNPWRCFELREDFDLVHCNVFPLALTGKKAPLVMSSEVPMPLFLRLAKKYSKLRIALTCLAEKMLLKLFKVQEVSLIVKSETKVILASERLRPYYKHIRPGNLRIIPPGLAAIRNKSARSPKYFTLGFIAKDYKLKGGPELLAAYRELRAKYRENIRLTIIGCKPALTPENCAQLGITWLPYVDRAKLLQKITPTFDLFVYPTKLDGLAKVVLEMLAQGIPCVVSDFLALPDMIENGYAGAVVKTAAAQDIFAKIDRLLDKPKLKKLSGQALELFNRKFRIDVVAKKLGKYYAEIIL